MPAFVATDGSFQHSRKIIRRLARDFKGRTAQSRSTRKALARHDYPWHNCIATQTRVQFWTKYSVQRWKGEPNMRNSFPIVLVWPDMRSNRSNRTRSQPGCQVALTALTVLTDWPISVLSGSVGHSTGASPGMTWRQLWETFSTRHHRIGLQGSTSARNMMKYIMIHHYTTGILTPTALRTPHWKQILPSIEWLQGLWTS